MNATITRTQAGATTAPVVPAIFQGREHVDMATEAVATLLGVDPFDVVHLDSSTERVERYRLHLSPGNVALSRVMPSTVWDRDRWETQARAALRGGLRGLLCHRSDCDDCPPFEQYVTVCHVPDCARCAYDELAARRGVVREWSAASRSRFHRRMSELDYSPWDGKRLGMVTLTLPHHWERIAPSGRVFKAILKAFRKRVEHAIAGPLYAVWKLEFQGRGAPHVHMLMEVPEVIAGVYGPTWLGRAWVEACAPVGRDRERMLRAHLPSHGRPSGIVDYSARMTDPKRIAVYFGKHASKTRDAKEYQHTVPELWQRPGRGPGRFWGYWSLRRAVGTVEVSAAHWFAMRRIMARVDRSRAARHQLALRAATRITGEGLRRATLEGLRVPKTRRYTGFGGGWTLSNDALVTAWDLARAVAPPT